MIISLLLIIGLILWLSSWLYIDWGTHLYMTNKDAIPCKWISYYTFKEMFKDIEWINDTMFPMSLFGVGEYLNTKTQIHASVFRFEGVNYKLYPISYIFANRLVNKYIKNLTVK